MDIPREQLGGCFATHVVNGVLIAQPIGTFDLHANLIKHAYNHDRKYYTNGVIHMPPPIIFGHVLQAD